MSNSFDVEDMFWNLVLENLPSLDTITHLKKAMGRTECSVNLCILLPHTKWGKIEISAIIAHLEKKNRYPLTYTTCHVSYDTHWEDDGSLDENAIDLSLTFKF